MDADFAEAFARLRDELKARIAQKVRAAALMVPEDDIAQIQNVIIWMTIDPELHEMLLVTALAPADWERLEPDLPKIRRVFREELAFARTALMQLKDECVRRGLADERHRQRTQGRHDEPEPQEGDQG
jgi:hypothetical protein